MQEIACRFDFDHRHHLKKNMNNSSIKTLFKDSLYLVIPATLISLTLFVSPLWGNVLLAWLMFGTLLTIVAFGLILFCETIQSFLPELKEILKEEHVEYNNALLKLQTFTFKNVISIGFIILYAYYGWWICFALASFNFLIPKVFATFAEKKEE